LRIAAKEEAIVKTKASSKKEKAVKVKVKKVVDDRKNFNLSTKAAALYFRDCYRNLKGDWLLTVASYNCGIGNVWQAMKACGKTDPDFWDIKNYLPAETRAYVMNFIAMNVIFNNYDAFLKNTLRFESVKVKASDIENTIQPTVDGAITDK
jgi:membrane-bound lytic murein transglycosylase MltF